VVEGSSDLAYDTEAIVRREVNELGLERDSSTLGFYGMVGIGLLIALYMVTSCVVDIQKSDDHKNETKYEQCGEVENETARTFCVTEA